MHFSRISTLVLVAFVLFLGALGCSKKAPVTPLGPPPLPPGSGLFPGLSFGSDDAFDIITWNVRQFPESAQTPRYLADALKALDADVVALQEIQDPSAFRSVLDELDGYSGYVASSASYDVNLAFIYKTSTVTNVRFEEIFRSLWRPFPRSPLVMSCTFNGKDLVIIDNHLKCCGDGTVDLADDGDEETRRLEACDLLAGYISDNYPTDRVIVLGDLNDSLTDTPKNNVFDVFLDDPAHYMFSDMAVAQGPSSGFSYVFSSSYSASHIDHILITDELFGDFAKSTTDVETIRPDKYLAGGKSDYEDKLSDHLPVGMHIEL